MRTPDSEIPEPLDDLRSSLINRRFGESAKRYERHAKIQMESAHWLANQIRQQLGRSFQGDVLEIGCGTGFLTSILTREFPFSNWLITDVSSKMLDQCRERLTQTGSANQSESGQRRFQVVDGQVADCDGMFDLICSNLTFQWFESLESSVSRLVDKLKVGGCLFFNILGSNSFREWKVEHNVDPNCPIPPVFPTVKETETQLEQAFEFLKRSVFELKTANIELTQSHPGFRDFFRSLKMIGANTPIGRQNNSISQLRTWLHKSKDDASIIEMNYEIISCCVTKVQPTNVRFDSHSQTTETRR